MGEPALAPHQLPAELRFENLDGAGQRGLRHIAADRSLGEVEGLAKCQEIADLVHFHGVDVQGRQPAGASLTEGGRQRRLPR